MTQVNAFNKLEGSELLEPHLTILTPSYNYSQFIEECVRSVKSQNSNTRVLQIVQDGCSSDGTLQVLKTLHSSGLKIISEHDKGQSDALNKALSIAGDNTLIGWLNADEYYLAGALDEVIEIAKLNPEIDVFYGDCVFVDEQGRVIRAVPSHKMSKIVLRHYGCFISSCTFFVRASTLKQFGWDLGFQRAMDWDLYLSLSRKHKFKYVNCFIGAFRVHSKQVTNTPEKFAKEEFTKLRAKHKIKRSISKTMIARFMHILLKLTNGGYTKQLAYQKRRGQKVTSDGFV